MTEQQDLWPSYYFSTTGLHTTVQKNNLEYSIKKKSSISKDIQQKDSKDTGKGREPSRAREPGRWNTSGMTESLPHNRPLPAK